MLGVVHSRRCANVLSWEWVRYKGYVGANRREGKCSCIRISKIGINTARDCNSFVALSAIEAAVLLFINSHKLASSLYDRFATPARGAPPGDFFAQRGFHAEIAA